MPENIIQIDQNLLETRLDRLITEKMTQILNATPDASGRRDHRGRQIRLRRGADVLLQLFLSAWGGAVLLDSSLIPSPPIMP